MGSLNMFYHSWSSKLKKSNNVFKLELSSDLFEILHLQSNKNYQEWLLRIDSVLAGYLFRAFFFVFFLFSNTTVFHLHVIYSSMKEILWRIFLSSSVILALFLMWWVSELFFLKKKEAHQQNTIDIQVIMYFYSKKVLKLSESHSHLIFSE